MNDTIVTNWHSHKRDYRNGILGPGDRTPKIAAQALGDLKRLNPGKLKGRKSTQKAPERGASWKRVVCEDGMVADAV